MQNFVVPLSRSIVISIILLISSTVFAQYVGVITGKTTPTVKLKKMNVYANKISLSGYSSGGGFAQQLQISYSSMFAGIAIFSQTFYRCGPGDGIQANFDNFCTSLGMLPSEHLWEPKLALDDIEYYYTNGLIENPKNLNNKKLYVFAGTHNYVYSVEQVFRVLDVYRPFIRNDRHIRTQLWDANHTMPSNIYGGSCLHSGPEDYFVGYCGLSGAYEALSFIHGKWAVPYLPNAHNRVVQPLYTFDQSEFFHGVEGEHGMDKLGFLYIPKKCKNVKCLLHMYFHGCRSGREFLGAYHILHSGFLQVAELNNIIMVFPQALSNTGENMIGCWDTYGLTGEFFATRKGAQVTIVRNMLARILGQDQVPMSYRSGFKIPFIPKVEIIM